MKKLTIESPGISLSLDEISDFEKRYEIAFADYFKEFLLTYNGAGTEELRYINQKSYIVDGFLPLLINRNPSIEMILPVIQDPEEGIGRNDLIPFATDPGGRPFYVSIGENDYGCVYYYVWGLGYEEAIEKIADSFEEFINGLQKEGFNG